MVSESEADQVEEEEHDDPSNSGMHTNDEFNQPDEQGRVLVNVGHAEDEPDVFVAPQIARIIKPHQIGGVRFLYDNIVESITRYISRVLKCARYEINFLDKGLILPLASDAFWLIQWAWERHFKLSHFPMFSYDTRQQGRFYALCRLIHCKTGWLSTICGHPLPM